MRGSERAVVAISSMTGIGDRTTASGRSAASALRSTRRRPPRFVQRAVRDAGHVQDIHVIDVPRRPVLGVAAGLVGRPGAGGCREVRAPAGMASRDGERDASGRAPRGLLGAVAEPGSGSVSPRPGIKGGADRGCRSAGQQVVHLGRDQQLVAVQDRRVKLPGADRSDDPLGFAVVLRPGLTSLAAGWPARPDRDCRRSAAFVHDALRDRPAALRRAWLRAGAPTPDRALSRLRCCAFLCLRVTRELCRS